MKTLAAILRVLGLIWLIYGVILNLTMAQIYVDLVPVANFFMGIGVLLLTSYWVIGRAQLR